MVKDFRRDGDDAVTRWSDSRYPFGSGKVSPRSPTLLSRSINLFSTSFDTRDEGKDVDFDESEVI